MALSGYLVTRFGSRMMALIAGIFYPAMLVALSLADTPTALFATLMCFGVAANLNNISINTQAVGVECVYGRSIMSSFHGLWSLAGFCGGILSAMARGKQCGYLPKLRGSFCFQRRGDARRAEFYPSGGHQAGNPTPPTRAKSARFFRLPHL